MSTITTAPGARRPLFEDVHDDYRESFRRFLQAEVVPHHEEWQEAHIVPRDLFTKAAEHGFLAMEVPEEYGGSGRRRLALQRRPRRGGRLRGRRSSLRWARLLHTDLGLPYLHRRRQRGAEASAGSRASPPARRSSRSR